MDPAIEPTETGSPIPARHRAGEIPRTLGIRLLAALLAGLWAGLGLIVLVGYRPGGPWDQAVGLAACVPAAIAAIAIVRPPVPGTWHGTLAVTWLIVITSLIVMPLIGLVVTQLVTGVGRTLLPSPEVIYAAIVATAATCLVTALGLVAARTRDPDPVTGRPAAGSPIDRRAGVFAAASIALATTLVIAGGFGAATWGNERGIDAQPAGASRFGPTDAVLPVPRCADPVAIGDGAALHMEAELRIDDEPVGTALLDGVRSGIDEAWQGSADGPSGPVVTGYVRLDETAAILRAGRWVDAAVDPFGLAGPDGLTVDGPVAATAHDPDLPPVAEDAGVELIEGAKARRCRTAIDGPTANEAFLPIRWLAGGDPVAVLAPLTAWRGTLDWWVFADGQLGQARLVLNGLPADAWDSPGIQGELQLVLTATDRDEPHPVVAPADTAPTPAASAR